MSLKKSLIELQKNERLSIKREVKKELTQIKKKIVKDKKCIICGEAANYSIKGSNDWYCRACALQYFGSLDHLRKI